jgi:hypothetical protein
MAKKFRKYFLGYAWEGYTNIIYLLREKKAPQKKFVIFTVGRSGSSLLVSLLQSHADIHCDGELLAERLFFPERYIKLREKLSKKDIYGFKLNTYHFRVHRIVNPPKFVGGLVADGYQIISLQRRNILRQAISHMYAVHRKKFHHKDVDGQQKQESMWVDLRLLKDELQLFEYYRVIQDEILRYHSYLCLDYEEDLLDSTKHQVTIDKVSGFLGIPSALVNTHYSKTTPRDLNSFIENYDEVVRYLRGTAYAEMLQM